MSSEAAARSCPKLLGSAVIPECARPRAQQWTNQAAPKCHAACISSVAAAGTAALRKLAGHCLLRGQNWGDAQRKNQLAIPQEKLC
jgi:hypothetical protein